MLTPGEFDVSPGGAASYSIKLRLPHGIAGVVPDLALTYNSQGQGGLLGVGWSLSGLSSITRCPQNRVQDGLAWIGGVNFNSSDRFCLDGQRLVAVPDPANPSGGVGTYGASSTFYATEVESFSKVQSLGAAYSGNAPNGLPTYGPSYFVVKTRAGLTMEYGNTVDSKVKPPGLDVIALWALNKVTDTKGNYWTVTYNSPDPNNGQSYPVRIDYTGNASVAPAIAPASRVDFEYNNSSSTAVTRPDVVPMFVGGALGRTTVRLTKVSMVSSGNAVREYRIAYGDSTAPSPVRSLVASIQECAPNGVCLPATTFQSSAPPAGWQMATWAYGSRPASPVDNQCLNGDFNGDGRADLACYSYNTFTNVGSWHMMLSTGSGWSPSYWLGGPQPAVPVGGQCIPGDFNGDGKTDFACYSANSSAWQMAFSTGAGWTTTTWYGPTPAVPVSDQCITGDFDANGKTDIACYTGNSGVWHVVLTGGPSWASQYWYGGPSPSIPISQQCFSGEFNGDGRTDLACYTGDGQGTWHVALSQGGGSWSSSYWTGGPHAIFASDRCVTGDFNGDGKTDLACYTGDGLGTWHVALSRGAGSFYSTYWSNGPNVRFPLSDQCRTGDFNGDGKTDLACQANFTGDWLLAMSSGTSWSVSTWPSGLQLGPRVGNQCVTGDFTGDGKTDIACNSGDGFDTNWLIASPSAEFNGLVKSIDRSLGNIATVTYAAPGQTLGNRYTRNAVVTFPQVAIVPGSPLVVDVDVPNGVGGTRRNSYWYDTAVAEQETGRGFLGFKSNKRVDVATGISSTTNFRLDAPFVGQIDVATTTTSAGAVLTQTTTTHACRDPAAALGANCVVAPGRRYFVFPQVTLGKTWDLNGTSMPWSRTTNQSLDAYGNALSVGTETLNADGSATDHSKWVTSTYYNNPSTWILGRLLSSTVAASGPTVAAAVIPGSGGLAPAPLPQLPPAATAKHVLPIILQFLLED